MEAALLLDEGIALAPISPELVLVTPELRPAACRQLGPPPSARPRVEHAPPEDRVVDTAGLRTLAGTVEVDVRVPVLLVVLAWAVITILRAAVLLAIPLVTFVAVLWVLSLWYG